MSQLLHYTSYGEGEPLLILHGLFGSGKNWQSLSKQFAELYSVYAVDLRNHGDSFHDSVMNYEVMAGDVVELINHIGLDSYRIIGHSMGGKVAMMLAQQQPQRVFKLIVADIAPVVYRHTHSSLTASILAVDLSGVSSRSEVDQALRTDIPDPMLRGFLLQNLVREGDCWRWRVNWRAIEQQMDMLTGFPLVDANWRIGTPSLFIRGEKSDYVDNNSINTINRHFSEVSVETIANAGHWLHAEQPARFRELAFNFLS